MKKILFVLAIFPLLVSVTYAGFTPLELPKSDIEEYNGYKNYDDNGVQAQLQFAVYDTRVQDLPQLDSLSGYGEETFVYAYHIFSIAGDPIDSVKIFGFNPDAVVSEDSLSASNTLGGNTTDGVEADEWALNNDEATWFITDDEELPSANRNRSWFLLMFSDYAPKPGDFEVNSQADPTDPLVPGVPEPATISLLICGTILSLKRRK